MRDRLLDVWERAKADTGIHVDFENVFMHTYWKGNLITHHAADGKIIGFLFFVHSHDDDTGMTFWIERMLWVDPEYRGERVGSRLLDIWMQRAKRLNTPITLHAGASLGDPEIAKSIYEAQGFKTTYAFQKEIT
jgi:GNAT superfamily N-acetyltransferase